MCIRDRYQFTEVYGATTKVRQSYSYKNTYSFTTTGIGTHIFYVDVKDDEGQVVRATYTMQVVVHPDNQLRGSFVSNTNGIATVSYTHLDVYKRQMKNILMD